MLWAQLFKAEIEFDAGFRGSVVQRFFPGHQLKITDYWLLTPDHYKSH